MPTVKATWKKISTEQMLPTRFQPHLKRQFILDIDGVDNFLVNNFKALTSYHDKKLIVELIWAIAPDPVLQLVELWSKQGLKAELKLFDAVGHVLQKITYHNVCLNNIEYEFDYGSNMSAKVKATFSFSNGVIGWPSLIS